METCIYLFDSMRNLTYEKKEHVITAGIGGKHTLPKGYVSDQANELFSKYELMCLRYSPLQIARAQYGPGKRGSLNINSISTPDVFALQPQMKFFTQKYVCPLGFLFQNQAYILPQIIILFGANSSDFSLTYLISHYPASGNISIKEFYFHLQNFLISNKKFYKNIDVPFKTNCHFVCLGWYKKSWYICSTQPSFDIDNWARRILEKKPESTIPSELDGLVSDKQIFKYSRKIVLENMVPVFIHAKNCFNVLALFQGYEFVQQSTFNQIRQCILSNSGWNDIIMPLNRTPSKISQWIRKNTQDHEHVVAVYTDGANIMALSVLYNQSWGLFKLGKEYQGEPFSRAIICDYHNKNEILYDSNII